MKPGPRATTAALVLLIGIAVSIRLDTGHRDAGNDLAAYSAADPARFNVSMRRGSLLLTGNTVSAYHEEQLRKAASLHFPDAALETDFRPLGVAPGWWAAATTELLSAIAALHLPDAEVRADRIRVAGLANDPAATAMELQSLRQVFPASADLDIRLQKMATGATAREICAREFAVFEAGPVNFEESGTEFRPSAYPSLDRVVALADACRDSTVSITGHSDSSGNEAWNAQLSLERARTVAGYIGAMGIDPERIVIAGAGSSLPVASNDTRFGRSLNRRIEIRFSPGRPQSTEYGNGRPEAHL